MVDFEEHMKLVPFTINKYFPEMAFDEDAMQEGYIALWKACQGYKPGKGAFSTYAVRSIKNHLMNYTRQGKFQPSPRAFFSMDTHTMGFRDRHPSARDSRLEELEVEQEMDEILDGFRETLATRPKQVRILNLLLSGLNLRQISLKLGCSHQNVDCTRKVLKRKFLKYLNKRARRETL